MAKKSRGRGWRWRTASGVEAVAEGGNDPAYPGSTVALCSPCLIVMDEPHSLARSDIRVRRVVYVYRPGRSHLSTPESGDCSCSALLHTYMYMRCRYILRTTPSTRWRYLWIHAGWGRRDGNAEHYFSLLSTDILLGTPSSLERSSRLDDVSYLTRTLAYAKYTGGTRERKYFHLRVNNAC